MNDPRHARRLVAAIAPLQDRVSPLLLEAWGCWSRGEIVAGDLAYHRARRLEQVIRLLGARAVEDVASVEECARAVALSTDTIYLRRRALRRLAA